MPNLILIPTAFELSVVEPYLRLKLREWDRSELSPGAWRIELCGFGLVAAAALTARAISRYQPQQMILLGIAGSLDDSIELGSACSFDRVTCHGIGVGNSLASHHQSASRLGWSHVEAMESRTGIGDTIDLDSFRLGLSTQGRSSQLVSVTTASSDNAESLERQRRFPDAVAEDMEGFAVALACRIANVPLAIVRGISNRAGERNHAQWQVKPSLHAATEIAISLIKATP